MNLLLQSSTSQPLLFLLVDSADHITGKTGLSPTVTLSKTGGAFAACAGAVTEIANGWYKVAGNATDTNTLGPLILHATGTGADPVDVLMSIVAFDPQSATNLGLANLVAPDNTGIAAIKAKTDNLPASPAAVGSAMTLTVAYDAAKTANSVAPDNVSVAAIKAKTDNLPASPAAVGSAMTLTVAYDAAKTANSVAPDNAGIAAIKAKTDNIPLAPAAVGSAMTLTADYDAAKTANSIAPDNASIAAIKAKTDNLPVSPAAVGSAMTLTAAYDAAKTANSVAPDNASVAAIKAKTDNLPLAPAAVGDIPSAATNAASVRTNLATELARIDVPTSSVGGGSAPSAATIAAAVWDEATAGHGTAGTTGAALQSAQAAGDPLSVVIPGAYADHTVGKIISKLDVGVPAAPVIVIPAAPADLSLCRVYGNLETVDNLPAANVSITFELVAITAAKSERLISGRKVVVKTNAAGQIAVGDALYVELQRNDLLTPVGTKYLVTCKQLNLKNTEITLTTDLFDLASIVV